MNNGIRSWKRGSWCLVKLCRSMRHSSRFVRLLPGGSSLEGQRCGSGITSMQYQAYDGIIIPSP